MKSIVIIAFYLQCCNIVNGMDAKMNGNKGETTTNTEQVGSKPPDDTYSTWAQAAPAWDVQPWEAPPVGGGSPPEAIKYVSKTQGKPTIGLQYQLQRHFPALNNAWMPYSASTYYNTKMEDTACYRSCSQQAMSAGKDAGHREQLHNHCVASCQNGGFGSFAYGTHGAGFGFHHPYFHHHPAAFAGGMYGAHPLLHPAGLYHPNHLAANPYSGLNGLYHPGSDAYLGKMHNEQSGAQGSFGLSLVDQHIACIAAGKLALEKKLAAKGGKGGTPTPEEIAESTRACAPLLQSAYNGGWNHGLAHGTNAFGLMSHEPHVTGFGTTTGQQFSLMNSKDATIATTTTTKEKSPEKAATTTPETEAVDPVPKNAEQQNEMPVDTIGVPTKSDDTSAAIEASKTASVSTASDEKSTSDPVKVEAEKPMDATATSGVTTSSFLSLQDKMIHPAFFKPLPHLAGYTARHGECIERCNKIETKGDLDSRVQQLQPCMEWCYIQERNARTQQGESLNIYAPNSNLAPFMQLRDRKSVDAAVTTMNSNAFRGSKSNEGAQKAMEDHNGFVRASSTANNNNRGPKKSWESAMNYLFPDTPPYTNENNGFEMRMPMQKESRK